MSRARPLTVGEAVRLSKDWLARKGSPSPRLDSELLVAEACGIRRLDLFLAPDRPVTQVERDRLREMIRRRAQGEPVAYLLGRKEFYGLEMRVTPAVLIPRPETESLVDMTLELLRADGRPRPRVVDVGTGSGAIACALATRLPDAEVLAVDVSEAALEVARENITRLGLGDRVRLQRSDLLAEVPADPPWDLIISNPPYVADAERAILDPQVRDYEPPEALFSGPEGIDHTARLATQAHRYLAPGGFLITETGTPTQRARVRDILASRFPEHPVLEVRDPSGLPVGLVARAPEQEASRGR